jgi:hypothetical protein
MKKWGKFGFIGLTHIKPFMSVFPVIRAFFFS